MAQPGLPNSSPITPDVNTLIVNVSPPFLSLIFNWGLFGILSTQVYVYYQAFPNDKPRLKALVYTVYALETAQTILLTYDAWHAYVLNFGNIDIFGDIGTTWLSVGIIGGIVSFLVQCFYAYRLCVISQSRILTWIIMVLAIISFGGAIATSVFLIQLKFFRLFPTQKLQGFLPVGIWQGAGSACDVVIAVCMTYYLRRLSNYGRVLRTQQFVSRIIRLTIETGTMTASLSIVALTLYFRYSPSPYYYMIPLTCSAKLYSNMMLVAMISRASFRVMSESTTWKDVELSQIQVREPALRFNVDRSLHEESTTAY